VSISQKEMSKKKSTSRYFQIDCRRNSWSIKRSTWLPFSSQSQNQPPPDQKIISICVLRKIRFIFNQENKIKNCWDARENNRVKTSVKVSPANQWKVPRESLVNFPSQSDKLQFLKKNPFFWYEEEEKSHSLESIEGVNGIENLIIYKCGGKRWKINGRLKSKMAIFFLSRGWSGGNDCNWFGEPVFWIVSDFFCGFG
jgi:hypothetical protein